MLKECMHGSEHNLDLNGTQQEIFYLQFHRCSFCKDEPKLMHMCDIKFIHLLHIKMFNLLIHYSK